MSAKSPVLASAQAQFPKSANKNVSIRAAWHPDHSTTGKGHPEPGGMDGWTPINKLATRDEVEKLRRNGFTWVNLYTGGTANPLKDVPISRLI